MALLSGLLGDVTGVLGDLDANAHLGLGVVHDLSVDIAGISITSTGALTEALGVDAGGLLGNVGGLLGGLLGGDGGLLGGIL